jgi:hypothetical protein
MDVLFDKEKQEKGVTESLFQTFLLEIDNEDSNKLLVGKMSKRRTKTRQY